MILLVLTGEHYIFYRQRRIGYKNREFQILKFATMLKDSPNMGTGIITVKNDPRVTFMGRFLRKTKINELPQIFNVLLGDMSIVGPRPLVEKNFKAYPEDMQALINNSKPGITGVGSIVFRDEETLISASGEDPHTFYKEKIAPYKGALEIWYLENRSLITDIKLIILTAWVILFPKSDLINKWFKNLPKRNF
jgi:lipopolysaccharide/colanic/teichoic acid biosynthesis glycosyltransferase